MRNIILGGLGCVIGVISLLFPMISDTADGLSTYSTGQIVAIIFGVFMLGAGGFYLWVGVRESMEERNYNRSKRREKIRVKKKKQA